MIDFDGTYLKLLNAFSFTCVFWTKGTNSQIIKNEIESHVEFNIDYLLKQSRTGFHLAKL